MMKKAACYLSLISLLVAGCADFSKPNSGTDLGPTSELGPTPDSGPKPDTDSGDATPQGDADAAPQGCQPSTESTGLRPLVEPAPLPAGDVRSCAVTLKLTAPGASNVLLASSFTNWDQGALPLTQSAPGIFSITVSPSTHAQLVPGQQYPYKFIVDGNWIIDQGSTYRAYESGCLNSAFRVPDCTQRPAIQAEGVKVSSASASVRFGVYKATDQSALGAPNVTLDGAALPQGSLSDKGSGRFEITLANLAAGKHQLAISLSDNKGRAAEPVTLPLWIEQRAFDWRDSLMYMIVVDRFANGNKAIDKPVGAPVEYPADWHGGDLQGALEVLKSGYFEDLGVNVIWLNPINEQAAGYFKGRDSGDNHQYAGYHGYWPTKARVVDPHLGGNAALKAFVDEAHKRGIRVLLDLINNQVHEQHEYVASNPGWFRTASTAGVCGITPGWGWSERPFDCLFAPYLPDINWLVPAAESRFIDDAVFWLDQFNVDGYRIDAVKHVETNSIFNLRAATARRFEQGGQRVFFVGETAVSENDSIEYGCGQKYNNGYQWIDAYVGSNGLDGQFDFPSHHRMQQGLLSDTLAFDELEKTVRKLETDYDPKALHVRFLGTHDSTRMASQANKNGNAGCRWQDGGNCSQLPQVPTDPATYQRLQRAFTVLLTLPGIPFIYYGDEIALPGGNDPDNRRDMMWDGNLAHLANKASTLSAAQKSLHAWVKALGQARRKSIALRRGRRIPLIAEADLYVYAYKGPGDGDLAIVVVNRGAAVTDRAVSLTQSDLGCITAFDASVGSGTATLADGQIKLSIGAGEATVLIGR
ncbi:MAG: hypothetical protein KC503_34910 [Myxococcales bacterium]|nr:hypothetical protein [Myxococcales bacterium]